jgi:hypothetical protein
MVWMASTGFLRANFDIFVNCLIGMINSINQNLRITNRTVKLLLKPKDSKLLRVFRAHQRVKN